MAPQKFTRKEITERNTRKDAVFVIDNVVYDVTAFMDEHPGGHEVLTAVAGKDATEDFNDIGHSLDAKELMKKFVIGEVVDEDRVEVQKRPTIPWEDTSTQGATNGDLFSSWKWPLLLGLLATVLYTYLYG